MSLIGSKRTWHLGWAMFAYGRQEEMAAARLSREPTSTGYPASLGTWGGKRLALRPGLRNDPIFRGGLSMGNPKVAIVAYCLAVGFILVVAFHSSSKTLITAGVPAVTPVADR